MELFKLLGTVAIENTGAKSALDETGASAEKAESKMSKAFSNIGNAAVKIGKVMAAGLAVGTTAVIALGKEALEGYADYEQLVGGVETLFGAGGQSIKEYAESVGKSVDDVKDEYNALMNAQETVLKNAEGAYKTAGMSMNEYMETVTGFSASLIQSLDGDTETAAKKAHQAITDMSDNANKMGTSMTLIQNAYGGFAKANYTMLDNLKLGYGGTQEEMQRLIQDAAKMKDVQEELGVTVDANSMSFGNIVDAISVVQKSMGIMGTTSKEASKTIAGSIGAMKSAWKNFVAGFANEDADMNALLGTFIESVVTVGKNIIPRIGQFFESFGTMIVENAPKMAEKASEFLSALYSKLRPKLAEFAGKIGNAIVDTLGISESLVWDFTKVFGSALPNQLRHFKESVEENFGGIGKKISEVFTSVYDIAKMFSESFLGEMLWNLTALVEFVYEVFVPAFAFLMNAFSDLSGVILEKISPALAKINEAFGTISYIIREAVTDYIIPVLSQFIEMIQTLWNENQDKITKIGELISIIADRISEKVAWLVGIIENYVYPFFIWLVGIVQNNMVYIQEWIQAILDVIGAIIDVFINLFQGNWSQMWQSIQDVMHFAGEALQKAFIALIQVVKSLLVGCIQFILSKVFGLEVDLEQKFTQIKDNIIEKWNNIKDSVSETVTNLKENVSQTFTDLKEALKVPINGIIGMVNKVIDALNSLSWNFPDWIPGFGGKSFSFNLKRVEYLAEGGILTSPTLLQYNPYAGTATIAGEAGAEAVIPIEKLRVWIAEEMAAQNYGVVKVLQSILDAILALDENMGGNLRDALAGTSFAVNNREFARLVKAVN